MALDPVVRDLDNPADRSLGRLQRIQPLEVSYDLDEGNGVVGVGIAAARHLRSEMTLYRRQAVVVAPLSFGIGGDAGVGCGRISGVADGLRLGGEASLA